MNGRSDDPLAMGAIALGGGLAVALTVALVAAPGGGALDGLTAPAVPTAPAPPSPPPPPHLEPYVPEPPVPPAPPIRFRPPVDYAPIPDFSDERPALRLTVIRDIEESVPGSIRFAVIRTDAVGDVPERASAEPAARERPPGG